MDVFKLLEGFNRLERELTVHAEVEEELVYPRLKQVKKLRATTGEAFDEGKAESKELGKGVEAAKKEKLKSVEAAHKADAPS